MTDFTNSELATITHKVRRDLKSNGVSDIPYSRTQAWAAFNGIKGILDSGQFRAAINTAITSAIAPETMTTTEKSRVFSRVMEEFLKGLV